MLLRSIDTIIPVQGRTTAFLWPRYYSQLYKHWKKMEQLSQSTINFLKLSILT